MLAVGAVASGVLVSTLGTGPAERLPEERLAVGYYIDTAELTGTGEDGRFLYRVTTREARQQLEDGSVLLDGVEVSYDPLSEVPWDLSAKLGNIPQGGKIIRLSGDVVATTRQGEGSPTTIRTDHLELDADSFVAYTDADVSIESSGNQLFATGMRAFLKEDRLQLMADVHGKFTP